MRALENFHTTLVLLLIGLLFGGIGLYPRTRESQAAEEGNQLSPVILSKSQLAPPLRTPLQELRFSPDGKYILVQDDSTIYLLTRDPLSVRFQIDARGVPPARFSRDPQKLIIATRAMGVEWRALPDGAILGTTVLASGKPCYDAQLSPQGDLYACIDRDLALRVFDVGEGQQIVAEKIGETPSSYVKPELPEEPASIPLWRNGLRQLPVLQTFLQFSPDGRFVVAASFHGQAIAVDLSTKNRIKLLEPFSHALDSRAFEFIAPDRVILPTGDRTSGLSLVSFPEGRPNGTLAFVGRATAASDPRYALVSTPGSQQIIAVDLQTGKSVEEFPAEKVDILDGNVVRYDHANNEIIVSGSGHPTPTAQMELPAGAISSLKAGAVSGDLQSVAIGVRGEGAIFQSSTGKNIARLKNLEGAWFDRNERCYAQVRETDGSVGLQNIDLTGGGVSSGSPAWFLAINQTKARLMFSGPVVISIEAPRWGEESPMSESRPARSMLGLHTVAFEKIHPESI